MSESSLPAINAGLNATATVLLCLGLAAIKSGRRRAHATVMRPIPPKGLSDLLPGEVT